MHHLRKPILALIAILYILMTPIWAHARIEEDPPPELDVPLSPELTDHILSLCEEKEVDPQLVAAVIEVESQFTHSLTSYNSNGSKDAGLMQINSVHWDRLAEDGLDVYDPQDNLEAGITMLSDLLEKYPTEDALAAYNAGEAGMRKGWGKGYAEKVLEGVA